MSLPLAILALLAVVPPSGRVAASYPGLVCLLISTLTVTCCATILPYLQVRAASRVRFAGLAAIAAAMMMWSARQLDRTIAYTTPEQLFVAIALTLALVFGVCGAWIVEVIRQRLIRLEEETLLVALLLAALPPVVMPWLFPTALHPRSLAVWFVHGVFWQLVCTYCMPPWQRLFPPRADQIDVGVLACHRAEAESHPRPVRRVGE